MLARRSRASSSSARSPSTLGTLSLLIVNAYAAAMIGRLRSLPMTFVGALIIGSAESAWQIYRTEWSTHFHLVGSTYLDTFGAAISILILFVVLLVLPNPRLRGHARLREFFPSPTLLGGVSFAVIVALGGIVISAWVTQSHEIDLANVFAFGIIALSLVPLTGFSGQVSLAQLSFAGIGAVTMAHLGAGGNPLGLVWAALVAGRWARSSRSPRCGCPASTSRSPPAAFAVALDRWVFNLQNFSVFGWFDVKLFETGSVTVDRLHLGGITFDTPRAKSSCPRSCSRCSRCSSSCCDAPRTGVDCSRSKTAKPRAPRSA